jgi:DNA polymerase (family 10)
MSHKRYSNLEVAEYLTNIATAYTIKNKTRFQIVAYDNAAETIISYPDNVFDLWKKDPKLLDSIPNIGPSIIKKIDYYFRKHLPHPAARRAFVNIPPATFTLTKIEGIGPAIAYKLATTFDFDEDPKTLLTQLIDYCQQDKISSLPGLGEKSQERILENTLAYLGRHRRLSFDEAQTIATDLIDYLKKEFPDTRFEVLGSLRRHSDTVGDIDLAAASTTSTEIISHFLNYPRAVGIIASGTQKASIRLPNNVDVDLMIKPPASFGALLQHFTGSKLHNIQLRRLAQTKHLSLSEYGIKDLRTGTLYQFESEEEFYKFLGFKYIPPQERLGEDELNRYRLV